MGYACHRDSPHTVPNGLTFYAAAGKKEDKNILFLWGIECIFDNFTEEKRKKYDNGIYILSVCKYIVDNVPNLYSINYETKGMIDTYYKQEIIDAYNKIKNNQK